MDIIREWFDWLRKKDLEAALEHPPLVRDEGDDNVITLHPTYDFRGKDDE